MKVFYDMNHGSLINIIMPVIIEKLLRNKPTHHWLFTYVVHSSY